MSLNSLRSGTRSRCRGILRARRGAFSRPEVRSFFDEVTFTASHVVHDPATRAAAIVDSVLDYDPASGRTGHASADAIVAHVRAEDLTVDGCSRRTPMRTTSRRRPTCRRRSAASSPLAAKSSACRRSSERCSTPAPSSSATDRSSTGCSRTATASGSGRSRRRVHAHPRPHARRPCLRDRRRGVPGRHHVHARLRHGARRLPRRRREPLYRSIRRLLALPGETRLFLCHDYKAPGREAFAWETTIAEERAHNIHVQEGVEEEEFVAMRTPATARWRCRG